MVVGLWLQSVVCKRSALVKRLSTCWLVGARERGSRQTLPVRQWRFTIPTKEANQVIFVLTIDHSHKHVVTQDSMGVATRTVDCCELLEAHSV